VRSASDVPWLLRDQLSELNMPWVALAPERAVAELLASDRPRPCLALLVDARLPAPLLASLIGDVRREPRCAELPLVLVAPPQLPLPDALRAEAVRVLSWPVRQSELVACVAALQQQPRPQPSAPRKLPSEPTLRTRVLVADDDEINQRVLRRMLSQLGCSCEFVDDGQRAVERALEGRHDVILMDCQMPWLDGFDAARRIRASERPGRRCRIVAMTGSTSDEDRKLAREAGMDGFLIKPVSLSQLESELRRSPAEGADRAELVMTLAQRSARSLDAMRAALDVRDLVAVARAARQLRGVAEALEEGGLITAAEQLAAAADQANLAASEQALALVVTEHAAAQRRRRGRDE
ncbi:MAG TPA: response regulator, partial [Polyangiales bacterium]